MSLDSLTWIFGKLLYTVLKWVFLRERSELIRQL